MQENEDKFIIAGEKRKSLELEKRSSGADGSNNAARRLSQLNSSGNRQASIILNKKLAQEPHEKNFEVAAPKFGRGQSVVIIPAISLNPLHDKLNFDLDYKPPTTSYHEWRAWAMYDFANSPYFYSSFNFLPLVIIGLASEYAQFLYCGECLNNEWAVNYESDGSCQPIQYKTNTTCTYNNGTWTATWRADAIFVPFFGMQQAYSSVPQVMNIISIFLQLFLFVILGGVADFGPHRKNLLVFCTYISAVSIAAVFFGSSMTSYSFIAAMGIISAGFINVAYVFLNAYLPLLALGDPTVEEAAKDPNPNSIKFPEVLGDVTNNQSSKGQAYGFIGALLFLMLNMVAFVLVSDSLLAARINISAVAVWSFFVTIYVFYHLKTRPGGKLPEGHGYFTIGFYRLAKTFKLWKDLKMMFYFLITYMLYSDGISTLTGAASSFALIVLGIDMTGVLIGLLIVCLSAVIGSYLAFRIQHRFHLSGRFMLISALIIQLILPIWSAIALTQQFEFFILCLVFGISTGPLNAYGRSIFAAIIPAGHEAEFFSLYQITANGTSFFGPILLTVVNNATGSYRSAFSSLIVFFALGIILLCWYHHDEALLQKRLFEMKSNNEISAPPTANSESSTTSSKSNVIKVIQPQLSSDNVALDNETKTI